MRVKSHERVADRLFDLLPAQMTVAEACNFMADPSVASVSYADKKAFLASKGVPAFVIVEAACTAPDTNLPL